MMGAGGGHTNFQSITKFCLPLLSVSIAASKLETKSKMKSILFFTYSES